MKFARTWLLLAVALFAGVSLASAQTTNGTISGHVADSQGLALPGVTVNASSPNLQGVRTVVTSENGDYVLSLLPSGTYTLSFELSGFQTVTKTATLAPTQTLPIDATMGPAAVTETVNVVGRAPEVLMQTAQVATNYKQDLLNTLPTTRDINATLLLAPAVHPTGARGAYSISGAMTFESLYLVNGVTVNENVRGQANAIYIADAVQETTVATAGVSAEYGRFSGGVVNIVTKSGGDLFSGSFRDTLANDQWRSQTLLPSGSLLPGDRTQTIPAASSICGELGTDPCTSGAVYPKDLRFDHVVPTYEYTFGGPIAKDHLWFFTAGRLQEQIANRQLVVTNIPYTFTQNEKRYEGKLTYSINPNHRFQGAYTKILLSQLNGNQGLGEMDITSLYNASNPQDLYTGNYNGVLSSTFFVEGRFSVRHWRLAGVGSPSTDLTNGTMVRDLKDGTRYWTSTFCGVCEPEDRNNSNVFVKGSYFLSQKGSGSHTMTFGYDTFNDFRLSDNHQSGSDWRINGTAAIFQGTTIYPQFLNASTTLEWDPIPLSSLGANLRTHSLFFNDNWRWNNHFTFNLGLRWDKNHGVDSVGNLVASDSALSPRFGVIWDPKGDGQWAVTASVGRYVAALATTLANTASAAGNPASYVWAYNGPQINPVATAASLVTTQAAIQQVFSWFNANGGTSMATVSASVPGVSVSIPNSLVSPNVLEYAGGVSRQISNRAAVRADYVYRDYRDFYSQRIDTSTGTVKDSLGRAFDMAITENTNALKRRYSGLTVSSTYRISGRTDVGGAYTLSRLWGNFDGENTGSGPVAVSLFQYPEYRQQSWYAPDGDLAADQRHRSRLWINYGVPKVTGLTVSLLENMASGVPYGAIGSIDARSFVNNPGYINPQGGSTENYYFTARDAFRTDSEFRTDFGASYNYSIKAATRSVDLFIQAQVLNLFNQFQLCGCGDSVFNSGGPVVVSNIGQAVLTNANSPSLAKFNPFTTTPVLGVNWNYGPNFGTALSRLALTSPQTFRLTFGIRF